MKNARLQKNLIDACYRGDQRKVALYLQNGASPNEPDERNYYPLHMACQEGHLKIVKLLLKEGAILDLKDGGASGETALFRAVGAGHIRIVILLIRQDCDVNARRGKANGDTPLHVACAWGRYKEACALVEAGANINALDDENHSPMYHAVVNSYSKIAAYLIKKGVACHKSSKKVLLDIAIANDDKKMLRVISYLNPTRQP